MNQNKQKKERNQKIPTHSSSQGSLEQRQFKSTFRSTNAHGYNTKQFLQVPYTNIEQKENTFDE